MEKPNVVKICHQSREIGVIGSSLEYEIYSKLW